MAGETDATNEVLRTWEAVAPAWERHRDRVFNAFRAVSDWLIDAVDPQPGETILELAAGPGETGFAVAGRVGATGRVISTDLAPTMIEAAKRGAAARGVDNVEFRVMDAQAMDLRDDSVDAVVCRFGVMLMPEPRRALAEAHRVLRSGGRLAYAVWGPPDRNPWISLIGMTLAQEGHVPPGDPFAPGGIFSLSPPGAARDRTAEAGFSNVRVEEIEGVQRFEDFDDYWSFQTDIAGPLADIIRTLPAGDLAKLQAALEEAASPFRTADGYEIPSLALGVSATA